MLVKAKAWKSLASVCNHFPMVLQSTSVFFTEVFFPLVPQSRLSWSLLLSQGAAEHVRERFLVCLLRAT